MSTRSSSRSLVGLCLSALGYTGFVAVTLWTVGFLAGVGVPRVVDGPHRSSTSLAVATDLALLGLFAVQHSLMARRTVKLRLRRWIPARLERATYVLATDLCLVLLLALWQPFGGEVWDVGGIAAVALWVLCAAGWVLAIGSTFAVDHLELTGLRQAGWAGRDSEGTGGLEVTGLHAIVRHPLMTGLLVAFWATPHLGAAHLLFALASTGYIALGVHYEERDLRRTFGAAYDEYANRVPALLPRLRPGRRSGVAGPTRTMGETGLWQSEPHATAHGPAGGERP